MAPPAGVDFTGRWKLNIADSDDPGRLLQAQFDRPGSRGEYGRSGSGGPEGRQGGGRGGLSGGGAILGPLIPSVGVLSDALRWPGQELEVKQVAGVTAFSSEGITRLCQPMDREKRRPHGRRDERPPQRDGGIARCGWEQKTLIVQEGETDEDHPPYEERYSLSEDGLRLIGVVGFTGGRSSGFTVSRVWDKTP